MNINQIKNLTPENLTFQSITDILNQLLESHESLERKVTLLETNNSKSKRKSDNDLFNSDEAAEYLGITVSTLYTKTSRDKIEVIKKCGRTYYEKSELDKYIKRSSKSNDTIFNMVLKKKNSR
jgi:excisionase family DNA binding protein